MKSNNFASLERFPLGTIHPQGFLKEQCVRLRDGMGGHLQELEPEMIIDPLINKHHVDAWGDCDQDGWGAEISGNYWAGYIQLAYTLNDKKMIECATRWIDTMLQKQRADGYLGTYYEETADKYEDYNGWGTACVMRGLIAFYEATGREDVLQAVYKCMLWFVENWAGEHKSSYGGAVIIEPMMFVYQYIRDERLVSFAEEYEEYLARHDIFFKSYKSMLGEYHYFIDHTAGVGTSVRLPALIYWANGREIYLKATEKRLKDIREHSTQLSGGPVSVTEYCGPVGSTTETEYCSFAFYNQTFSYMSFITGEAKYGDYMEELFYNGAQGARKKDERAIAYLSAPNQYFATDKSSTGANCLDMQVYAPCYPVSCCPVNAVSVVPEFIRGMILHNGDDLYFTAYGPCEMEYNGMRVTEETLYPFRNNVTLNLSLNRKCSVFLKHPEWAEQSEITVNGVEITADCNKCGYFEINRAWGESDTVKIKFTASVRVIRVDDTDCSAKYPIAFKYGALLFSMPFKEKWTETAGNPMTPLPDGWHWYNVTPDYAEPDTPDQHDRLGMRRYCFPWNVAVDENIKADEIEVVEREATGYPWEDAPIELHINAWKAPFLTPTYAVHTFEPFGNRQPVTEPIRLTLVPYGATNLRVTYFPRADIKKK